MKTEKNSVSSLQPHHLLFPLPQIRFLIKEATLIAQEFIGPRIRKTGPQIAAPEQLPWPWFRSVFSKSYRQKRQEVDCLIRHNVLLPTAGSYKVEIKACLMFPNQKKENDPFC